MRNTEVRGVLGKCVDDAHGGKVRFRGGFGVNLLKVKEKKGFIGM